VASTSVRLATGTALTAVTATLLVGAPTTAGTAEAATRIKVADQARERVLRTRIVRIAKSKVGRPYRWGAAGPRAFDCSGLVVYSYRKATGRTLPRTSSAQMRSIRHVRKRDRRVGDLVFMHGGGHVAIYIGRNRVVHASNPSRGIRYDRLSGWYGRRVASYGRVISVR
jgi:cell wall-associated NlpC family hydrolase